jgi:two-component system invasion response regulator UvrY
VDLNMPVMDGYATIAWLREHAPTVLPLALTFDAADDALVRSVRAGARGFLLKNTRPAVLKTALDSLMLTGYYYTDQTHQALQDEPVQRDRKQARARTVLEQITPREMEFLLLVCDPEEYTYEQIADRMGVHRRTVDNHRIASSRSSASRARPAWCSSPCAGG